MLPAIALGTPNAGSPTVLRVLGTALVYWAAGKLVVGLAIAPGYATPVWPAAGFALCAVLVWGERVALGVLLGSTAVNLTTSFEAPNAHSILLSIVVALTLGLGAALQALLGARLIEHFVGMPGAIEDRRAIARFTALGGPVACLLGASVGVATLYGAGLLTSTSAAFTWATWWVGDTIGVSIFAPLSLIVITNPKQLWRRGRATVALPMLGSFGVVTLLFLQASSWEQSTLRAGLEQRAAHLAHTLQATLSEYQEAVIFLAALFDASADVTRGEFHEFSARALERYAGLEALGWSPLVSESERSAYEGRAASEGLRNFSFTERDAAGAPHAASIRPSYIPLFYAEPIARNAFALGLDAASDPACREALQRAAEQGTPSVTSRLRWLPDSERHAELALFVPIFAGGAAAARDARKSVLGYASGVLALDAIIESAFSGLDRGDLDFSFSEDSVAESFYDNRSARPAGPHEPVESFVESLSFGGRRYRLDVHFAAAAMTSRGSWQAWLVLGVGLLFVRVMGVSTLVSLGRTSRAERNVEEEARRSEVLEEHVRARTAELSSTLREREVLLQEIHHRVKNNLQVISSLINMQMRRLEPGLGRDALSECQSRVYTIALIHETLYESRDYAEMPFSDYVRSLATSVFQLADVSPATVALKLDLASVALPIDRAIPCGLILNELIVNALKHAFPEGRAGNIWVLLRRPEEGRVALSVRDDGTGAPETPSGAELGLTLVRTLAKQIHAELVVQRGPGTLVELNFAVHA